MNPILIDDLITFLASSALFFPRFSVTYFKTPLSSPAFPITSANLIKALAKEKTPRYAGPTHLASIRTNRYLNPEPKTILVKEIVASFAIFCGSFMAVSLNAFS